MKTLNEAIKIFENNINNYQLSCKYNNEILSDTAAFFLNLLPWGKKHGGETGYQRSLTFLRKMKEAVSNGILTETEQLLDFAMHYPDKGYRLSENITLAVILVAGFSHEHIDYFVSKYQQFYTIDLSTPYDLNDSYTPPTAEALNQLCLAIKGIYSSRLCKCLNTDLGLTTKFMSRKVNDNGKTLLNFLDDAVSEREMKDSRNLSIL